MANEKINQVWLSNGETNDWMPGSELYYAVNQVADVLKDDQGAYIFNQLEDGSPWCSYIKPDVSNISVMFGGKLPQADADLLYRGGGKLDSSCTTSINFGTFFGIMVNGRRGYDIRDRYDMAANIYKHGEGVSDTSNWYPYQRTALHPLTSYDLSKIVVGYQAVLYNPTTDTKVGVYNIAQLEQYKHDYPVVLQIDFYTYYDGSKFNGCPYIVSDISYNGNRYIGGRILNRIYPYTRSTQNFTDGFATVAPNNICVNDNYTDDFGNPLLVDSDSNWFGSWSNDPYHFLTLGTEHYEGMEKMIHGLRSEYLQAYVSQTGFKSFLCNGGSYLPSGFENSEGFSLNVVESNGENRGETYTGQATHDLPNYSASDIKVDVDIFIDTNTYTERITLPEISITLRNYFANFFAVSDINLTGQGALLAKCFPLTSEARDELKAGTVAYGSNPIDSIRSFRVYPLDLDYVFQNAFQPQSEIHLGSYNTGVKASKLIDLKKCVLDVGEFVVPPKYNDWRDTDQYVKIQIFLPYIGMTDISYQQNIKKTIKIKYIIDITSGVCEAVISADGLIISSGLSGQIGFDMSVAGDNVVSYSSMERQAKQMELQRSRQRFNDVVGIMKGVQGVKQSAGSAIAAALTGGAAGGGGGSVGGAVTDLASQGVNAYYNNKLASNDIDWSHQTAESLAPISMGVSGSMADLLGYQNIIVTFVYTQFEYPELVDKRSGGMIYQSAKLNTLSGYVQTKDAMLKSVKIPSVSDQSNSGVPTSDDLEYLRQLLNSGVYIYGDEPIN